MLMWWVALYSRRLLTNLLRCVYIYVYTFVCRGIHCIYVICEDADAVVSGVTRQAAADACTQLCVYICVYICLDVHNIYICNMWKCWYGNEWCYMAGEWHYTAGYMYMCVCVCLFVCVCVYIHVYVCIGI